MKKILVTLVAIVAITQFSYSQNSNPWPVSGSVGIGTTTPKGILGLGNQTKVVETSGITLGYDQSSIEFVGSSWGSGYGHKIYSVDPGNGAVDLRFAIRQGTTSWTDALTIRSNTGNVGIGTAVPGSLLDLYHTGTGAVLRVGGNATGTSNDAGIDLYAVNGSSVPTYARIGLGVNTGSAGSETGYLDFSTINGGTLSEKMRILANGNVGIGTMGPVSALNIAGTTGLTWGQNVSGLVTIGDLARVVPYGSIQPV